MTNDTVMTEVELLAVYKRQPGGENRHHVLEGVVGLVPIFLKSNERIDAFAFLGYVAVLLHVLIERELRRAVRGCRGHNAPLYPENRACTGPTATRVVKCFDPSLSRLHRQVLELFNGPVSAYQSGRTTAV